MFCQNLQVCFWRASVTDMQEATLSFVELNFLKYEGSSSYMYRPLERESKELFDG